MAATGAQVLASRKVVARNAAAVLLLLPLLGGCAAQMRNMEARLDTVSQDTQALRTQQSDVAGDVTQIRSMLESEGNLTAEQRAELLTRIRSLESGLEQLTARSQEQEAMLRRMSAALDQLTREAGLPGASSAAPAATQAPDSGAAAAGGAPATHATTGGVAASPPSPASTAPSNAPPTTPAAGAAAAAGGAGQQASSAPGDGSTELVVYDAAMRDFTRGSYALARDGFEELLRRFPQSELADNACYWLGETYYAEGKYQPALERFQEVLQTYPKGDILPSALLKMGYCHLELGDREQAIAAFQQLRREYPGSDEAAIAEHKLNAIGSRP